MTGPWSALDATENMAAILGVTLVSILLILGRCWSRIFDSQPPEADDHPTADDLNWAALLEAVQAARDDIDHLDELDLKADDYCEWLELRYQWMGSDQ